MEHRAVICVPSNREVPIEVADSLAGVYGRGLVDGTVTAKLFVGDTYLDAARNLLVTYALDLPTHPTHIFWMDDDMLVPPDAVARLLAHDLPVVGGLYHQRAAPFRPVAYREAGGRSVELIDLPDRPFGLLEVDGMGLGCCLVRLDLYLRMVDAGYGPRWHRVDEGVGEDITFFRAVREMGVKVFLDCDLRCGHVRRETVGTVHYESYRRAHPTAATDPDVASRPT